MGSKKATSSTERVHTNMDSQAASQSSRTYANHEEKSDKVTKMPNKETTAKHSHHKRTMDMET